MAKVVTAGDVARLTDLQRSVLIEYIDREIPVIMNGTNGQHRTRAVASLWAQGYLINAAHNHFTRRPRALILSETGRYAVAMILAQHAETLVAAGCLEPAGLSPLEILAKLKRDRTLAVSAKTALEPAKAALAALEK